MYNFEKEYETYVKNLLLKFDHSKRISGIYALQYNRKLKTGKLQVCSDISSYKQREKYNKLFKILKSKKYTNYLLDAFEEYDQKDILKLFLYIIENIFGSLDIIETEMSLFLKKIHITNKPEILDCNICSIYNPELDKQEFNIEVPSITNLSAVVCLVHSFIQFHFRYNDNESKIMEYDKIIAIYAEKVAAHILVQEGIDNSLIHKIESARLDSVVWHYDNQIDVENMLKQINQKSRGVCDFKEAFQKRFFEEQAKYEIAVAQSYGLGYIYAENLFQLYLENPKEVSTRLRNILFKEEELNDVIKTYKISLTNKANYSIIQSRVDSI